MSRLGQWWLRHRRIWWLHKPLHWGSYCLLCRAVWAHIESVPEWVAGIERGIADADAGRWYDTSTGTTPNPDWPKDGVQP